MNFSKSPGWIWTFSSTFPREAEKPSITVPARTDRVINVVIAGDLSERDLKQLGEQVRDEITSLPDVTQVRLKASRPYEISIEVSEHVLQQYKLSIDQITQAIRRSSLDLSAGRIKTEGGDILLRTRGQAYNRDEFAKIVLLTRDDGTRLTLGDVASINDGFEETPVLARLNGKRVIMVDVFRVGDQNVLTLGKQVKEYIKEAQGRMPPGVELTFWQDRSDYVYSRLKTLTDSAMYGGVLVFLVLAMFLRFSLAIWVSLGIPISFLGALALMPYFGVSINMITMFAFILALGIVVDDAIVTGESVFNHMRRGEAPLEAAIKGTQEVAVPVTFGVLTTVVAFLPLMAVEGFRGAIFLQIPMVMIPVLLFSLVESKLILPSHLKHCKNVGSNSIEGLNILQRIQRRFANGLERFVEVRYRPALEACLRRRYLTVAVFIGGFILMTGFFMSDRIRFVYWPKVPRDYVAVRLVMPVGTPIEVTAGHIDNIERKAFALRDRINEEYEQTVIKNVLSTSGGHAFSAGWSGGNIGSSHLGEVVMELESAEDREIDIDSKKLGELLRDEVGFIAGVKELTFRSHRGGGGSAIDIQLTGPDFADLSDASGKIKEKLTTYPGLLDILDSFETGKEEFELKLKPEAEYLGLTVTDLARQVRQAFFGSEAQRIQRGRDDVRVMVRYPEEHRRSLASLENMRIRAPDGTEVPFSAVAEMVPGRSLPSIRRIDRNRTLSIEADVNQEEADISAIRQDLTDNYLPELMKEYSSMGFSMEGEAREQRDSLGSLYSGVIFVLFAMYGMLAIPFRSYLQPFIVMSVIPFGLMGALLGHIIMRLDMSIMSLFGCLALSGVVVNDSLVLVHYINSRRSEGMPLVDAVRKAGAARFRPILLTSMTTFAGLLPLMFERSRQAQWLIPMTVSLAFGVMFATVITLILVPISYLILEDMKTGLRRLLGLRQPSFIEEREMEPVLVGMEQIQTQKD